MEETKSVSSGAKVPVEPNTLHYRGRPDVPEDVDFALEHLNDPNLDLRAFSRRSLDGHRDKKAASHYSGAASDVDTESHFDSTSRAESRYDAGFDFEK